jgi:hypothetical protein
MTNIKESITPQELAMHYAGELLPQSAAIVLEDIRLGHIVMANQASVLIR